MAVTKPRGQWQYEDLFTLPDDGRRYEIIDGELFEMPAPAFDHDNAVANLFLLLGPIVRSLGGRIFTAPMDVFFAGANPIEPDVLILLPDRLYLRSQRGIEGAPNLLIEVLSPSNPTHDLVTKRDLYARGGVLEYWLVDPDAATIEILALAGDHYRTHVRAAGDLPVSSTVLAGLSFPAAAFV
jgi:Uma2 family endonuclease